jgi:DNA-binding winged helix-turn-helix (wHTH) protein
LFQGFGDSLAHTLVPQPRSHESARFGPFRLNAATGELWKDDRKIPLQRQPGEILALLLERPGEVVTPEEIRRRL